MADVSKISINSTTYDIKDATARERSIPAGGTTGQVLRKKSNTNYDTEWANSGSGGGSGLPSGGTVGQVLVKNSSTDGDAGWYTQGHFPTDKWYLPTGILEENVVAAYQFVSRLSLSEALININDGTEYALTQSGADVTWTTANGFYIPDGSAKGLNSSALTALYENVYSGAFGFSGATVESGTYFIGGIMLDKLRTLQLMASINYSNNYRGKYPGINASSTNQVALLAGSCTQSGVLGGNWASTSSIYRNGAALGIAADANEHNITLGPSVTNSRVPPSFGNHYSEVSGYTCKGFYITAVVLYNVALTASQHLELSNNITALGGIA